MPPQPGVAGGKEQGKGMLQQKPRVFAMLALKLVLHHFLFLA